MSQIRRGLAFCLAVTLLIAAGTSVLEAAEVSRRTLLAGTRYATELVEIDSGLPGPTVWISGGVHGSELAGWRAAERIAAWDVARGRLVVIPHVNRPAVEQRRRSGEGDPDLNRQFPERPGQKPRGALAAALWEELRRYDPDWVFDLHEALDNRNLDRDSVGQTIIVHPAGGMPSLAGRIIRDLNRDLPPVREFQVIRNPVQGSLADAAGEVLKANAAIVETSRRYGLEDRIAWHLRLMRFALEELDMNPRTASLLVSGVGMV